MDRTHGAGRGAGRGPSMTTHRFHNTGEDWSGLRAATTWLDAKGYSSGRMQGSSPIGILHGDYDIQKWRNLNREQREVLDGTITLRETT